MLGGKHIVVVGAGVIGLQSAIALLEAGYKVTVIGKHLPGDLSTDYTSPWAAAMWRSNALPDERELQAWDRESYRIWLEKCEGLGKHEKVTNAITGLPMRLLWTGPHPYIPDGPMSIWYARDVRNYQVIPTAELPSPFVSGATHDGIAVNTTPYLVNLALKVQSLGGTVLRAELPTDEGLPRAIAAIGGILQSHRISRPIDLVVNATGLGAHWFVPDPNVYPVRGQTVTVKGEAKHITTMFYPDENASVTPRIGSGISVLGSTYQEGNWDTEPDDQVTQRILERCKPMAPELLNEKGEFEVVSVNVAFRPGRKGGPRVELEELEVNDQGLRVAVCHTYGHAGGGFQNSFGSARKVVEVVNQWFKRETGCRPTL